MKNLPLFFLLWASSLFAQTPESAVCGNPQSQIDLNGNALSARILGAGDFGWDLSANAAYFPNFDQTNATPATIFLAGLWYGGVDPAGNLILKATDYRNTGETSFFAGPLHPQTGSTEEFTCANWDRHFRVTAAEVNFFLTDLADGTLSATHPAIRGWPAIGNPFFADVWGFDLPFTSQPLASFHDEDNDGLYNPMAGDYPVVKLQGLSEFVPDQQIWQVTNDEGGGSVDPVTNGKPLNAEIQITYFVFNCPDNPLLNNAMFSSHRLINWGTEFVDSFSLAMYVDFDLGCYRDDYLGCDPSRNTFYVYNRTDTDQANCEGLNTFGAKSPVQAVTFLNKPLDRFIPIYNSSIGAPPNGTTDPTSPPEFFNYLHGTWRDGTPLTFGGNGYNNSPTGTPTTHAFPDDPNSAGWSMKTTNQPARDQRALAIHEVGTLVPGQILELHSAWSFHRGDSLDYLGNVTAMLTEVSNLKTLYVNNFDQACSTLVSTGTSPIPSALRIWPNPASGRVQVHIPEGAGMLRVFSQAGILMAEKTFNGERLLNLETRSWPNGVYFLQVNKGDGVLSQRIVVAH